MTNVLWQLTRVDRDVKFEKSVGEKDVVQEVEVRYEVSLKSSAVSGVLRNLVEQKALKGLHAGIKGR